MEQFIQLGKNADVSGKCRTCFRINVIRCKTSEGAVLVAARVLHQMHRGGLYMIKRQRYSYSLFYYFQVVIHSFIHFMFFVCALIATRSEQGMHSYLKIKVLCCPSEPL